MVHGESITAYPISESNIFLWEAQIAGPPGIICLLRLIKLNSILDSPFSGFWDFSEFDYELLIAVRLGS